LNILLIGASPRSLVSFRGDMIRAFIARGYQVTAMAGAEEPFVRQQLAAMGADYRTYPVQRNGLNPFKDIQTFLALRRTIKQLKPAAVLCYTIKPVIWGGLAVRCLPDTRFYALITGLGFAFQNKGIRRKMLSVLASQLYRQALARASRVIFQNPDNRDLFVKRSLVNGDKTALVDGSGVNLERYPIVSLPEGDIVFLTIGRLLGEKGFREYALAASIVKERYPLARFDLVGGTDPSPDGIPLAEVVQWDAVTYHGSTDDVRPFLADCHVFVLPSYYLEGIPRTILEALSVGRPILTTDNSGCRETVIPGENGWLVPKRDAKALAERMIWFIENRDQWQRMAQRSRQMAEERFDVHKVNRDLMEIMGLNSRRGT